MNIWDISFIKPLNVHLSSLSMFDILKIAFWILDQMWSIYLVLFAWLSVCHRHTSAYPEKERQSYVISLNLSGMV